MIYINNLHIIFHPENVISKKQIIIVITAKLQIKEFLFHWSCFKEHIFIIEQIQGKFMLKIWVQKSCKSLSKWPSPPRMQNSFLSSLTILFLLFYKSKCPYVCVCFCLCVCQSHFLTSFNGLFAPTSQSPMSKLFRFSESFGKSNGKKWSQIWKLLLIKGVKLPRQKKLFL